jgi:hypothetical protein
MCFQCKKTEAKTLSLGCTFQWPFVSIFLLPFNSKILSESLQTRHTSPESDSSPCLRDRYCTVAVNMTMATEIYLSDVRIENFTLRPLEQRTGYLKTLQQFKNVLGLALVTETHSVTGREPDTGPEDLLTMDPGTEDLLIWHRKENLLISHTGIESLLI